jgi:hypothetical protein
VVILTPLVKVSTKLLVFSAHPGANSRTLSWILDSTALHRLVIQALLIASIGLVVLI